MKETKPEADVGARLVGVAYATIHIVVKNQRGEEALRANEDRVEVSVAN